MDPTSSRIRTYELPKPEAGLAEWTSKIKALQRQVDADEEAEQKRLEEEIAAFRAARLRRNQGIGYGFSSPSSFKADELTNVDHKSTRIPSQVDVYRRRSQDVALSKPTAKPPLSSSSTATATEAASPPLFSATPRLNREPISLAQFMGGRATGPRLNRHAPQQDAYDPPQVEQRTKIDTPHPVFGRGGIGLPGMTRTTVLGKLCDSDAPRDATQASVKERDRRLSMPEAPSTIHPEETAAECPVSLQAPSARSRTISTPPGLATVNTAEDVVKPSRQSPSPPSVVKSPTLTSSGIPEKSMPSSRPLTPRQPHQSPAIVTPPSPGPRSVITPSLTRPLLPTAKPPQHRPNPGASATSSLAFLKPPVQKDPTPSISRLQGRGFVQSMVQASSQLENRMPSPPAGVEKPRPVGGGKKASVLDRWQPVVHSATTSTPPPVSPKPTPLRKSKTIDLPSHPPNHPLVSTPPLKIPPSIPSLPSMINRETKNPEPRPFECMPPVNTLGLGSATTMVVYKEDSPLSVVDELGVRRGSIGLSSPTPTKGRSSLPAPSGKPLAHPTRERAKVNRKHKGARSLIADDVSHKSIPELTTPTTSSAKDTEEHKTQPLGAYVSSRLSDLLPTSSTTEQIQLSPSDEDGQNVPLKSKRMVGPMIPLGPAVTRFNSPTPSSRPAQMDAPSTPQSGMQTCAEHKISLPYNASERMNAPNKHARIPTTGNRPTVMDVAQTFTEQTASHLPVRPVTLDIHETSPSTLSTSQLPPNPSHANRPPAQSEKQKSSYTKHSAITLPPLREENTPASSPAGTLARRAAFQTSMLNGNDGPQPARSSGIVRVFPPRSDEPLPHVEVDVLTRNKPPALSAEGQTISVDVISISGNTATTVLQDHYIFYDSEIIGIIHRLKVSSTGLVSSAVWGWLGKYSQLGEREGHKLQELARRYGTSLITVYQHQEPSELVRALGGQLITRQGTRAHWSPENTCMYLARISSGVIYIDEHNLNIKNLCSGFSYCLSVLDTIYVWHGRGSTGQERAAITQYAHRLSSDLASIHELVEGENDDDEMFWLILGSDEYARADYWQWRQASEYTDPQVWRIDSASPIGPVHRVLSILEEKSLQEGVFLIDCIWEFFVLVGMRARGRRMDIRLAMSLANELSVRCAKSRPFVPPVHALVLPTQLPCDLLLSLRGVEEGWLNEGNVPDHMNILPYENALQDLSKNAFEPKALKDCNMLPLGVASSDLS